MEAIFLYCKCPEYVALIVKHLPKDSIKDWIKIVKSTWNKLYQHLELTAKIAHKILTNKPIVNALTKDELPRDKPKCTNCGKSHGGARPISLKLQPTFPMRKENNVHAVIIPFTNTKSRRKGTSDNLLCWHIAQSSRKHQSRKINYWSQRSRSSSLSAANAPPGHMKLRKANKPQPAQIARNRIQPSSVMSHTSSQDHSSIL